MAYQPTDEQIKFLDEHKIYFDAFKGVYVFDQIGITFTSDLIEFCDWDKLKVNFLSELREREKDDKKKKGGEAWLKK